MKPYEQAAILSLRRYVLVASTMRQITVTHRAGPADPWIAEPLCDTPDLARPEIGTKISVARIYRNLAFSDDP